MTKIDQTWIGKKVLYVTEDGKSLAAKVFAMSNAELSGAGAGWAQLQVGGARVIAKYDPINHVAETFHLPEGEVQP